MSSKFKQNFEKGVNLDLSELKLPPDAVQFLKNVTGEVNQNPGTSALAGANMGVKTPLEGNVALPITLPAGTNHCVGFYNSEQTNEGYIFYWNSANEHTIWVINGDSGSIRLVYQGSLLPFQLLPEYFIAEGRCTLELRSYIDPSSQLESNFKFLIFTNNLLRQYFISVEDSIATSSFALPAPYFAGSGTFYEPVTLIHLGVPTPISNIGITPVATVPGDAELQNQIVRQAIQIRVKFIDVFGRESEWSNISNNYISIVGGGCIGTSNTMSRCIDISFDAGNPLVDTIIIAYRKWVGNDFPLESGWLKYDTINKWINNPSQHWYERSANATYYDTVTNQITYRFCADKIGIPIPESETERTQPGLSRTSNNVWSINKRIGLDNNIRGFQPIDPIELAKISFFPVIPSETPCTIPPTRTITAYANIYRPYNDSSGIIRESHDKIVFGNEDGDCGGSTANSFRMDQVFGDQDNPGFIFYLAGTPYSCIAQWGELDIISGNFYPKPTYPGSFTYQPMCRIQIVCPAGKYILRGASHKSKITDGDYQSTSTYVAGFTTLNAAYSSLTGPFARQNYAQNPIKEMEIDCTLGDINYNYALAPMFVILDLSGSGNSAIDGYLIESTFENIPVEMNPILITGGTVGLDAFGSFFTDHNGYYFGVVPGNFCRIDVIADKCDGAGAHILRTAINNQFSIVHGDGSGIGAACDGSGNWKNKVALIASGHFPEGARRKINQSVFICSSTTAINNLPIVMTKGAVDFTDSEGEVTFTPHNRYTYLTAVSPETPFLSSLIPDYGISPDANDSLIFVQKGGCKWTNCSDCTPSILDVEVVYFGCGGSRETTLPDAFINLTAVDIKGVQTGGRYGVGIVLFDEIGRRTFVQTGEGEAAFVTMPNLNDVGYQKFLLPSIGYSIGASFTVPSYFKKLMFLNTENTNFSDYISLGADYIQFVDNTGNTNIVSPTQIRIYYGSLNEYNKQNNNSTNSVWQFISTGQNNQGAPIEGDIVQFIMNGNGQWLTSGLSATVTYDSTGYFFTIDYEVGLQSLINGALFRIIRPRVGQINYLYYEQCKVLDLVDGQVKIADLTGVIPYVDGYMLARQLPVPILEGQPGPIAPGGIPPNPIQYTSTNLSPNNFYATNNANNSNAVLIKTVVDALTSFPFYFESPSPSDFWGSHLADKGRPSSTNKQETQQRIGTEIALSAALGDRSVYNGLSYFENKDVFALDRNTWGDIIAVLVQVNKCLVICESDHFFIDYNTSNVKINSAGNLVSESPFGPFSPPRRPTSTAFGCSMQDINTIRKYAGKVMWLDHSGWLVMNDFTVSKDVSTYDPAHGIIGGYSGYLMNKISGVNLLNSNPGANGLSFFVGGIDPRTNEYYLTMFNYPSVRVPSYTNYQSAPSLYRAETIMIDLDTGMLKGFPGFTPEMYGLMPSYYSGRNFFTFKNGIPYKHHQGADITSPPLYANFYGEQMPCYIIPVVNPASETVKRFFWVEVYTKQNIPQAGALPTALFYCESITTEKGQVSRLTPERFVIRDGFQAAEFLCDLNTPFDPNLRPATTTHKILDGNPLIGRWAKLTLKTNPAWEGTYFELSAVITGMNDIKISGE